MELTPETFINFLVKAWTKVPEPQEYAVPLQSKERQNLGPIFSSFSLKDCFEQYSWGGRNYFQTNKILHDLRGKLIAAIEADDHLKAKEAAYEIYQWGGVRYKTRKGLNASGRWFETAYEDKSLITKLRESVDVLESGDLIEKFDGKNLIMNSGYTKVASLLSSISHPLIIMDGRVGAALGDMIVMLADTEGYNSVHPQLLFPWGAERQVRKETQPVIKRNPSTVNLKFPRLFGAKKDFLHAKAMYFGSHLLRQVVLQLQNQGEVVEVNELEASLFMWGYDVISRRKRAT